MLRNIKNIFLLFIILVFFVSCNNLFETIDKNEEAKDLDTVSFVNGDCAVSFSILEASARTVMPDYSYDDCRFNLSGTFGDESEKQLLEKVTYDNLIKPSNVSVKPGTWTFTVDCFDENNKKILSGTSIPVNITSNYSVIQIPMTFITGNAGGIEVSLTFPKGSGIGTASTVKAGLFNSPLAAVDSSCSELTKTSDGDNYKVVFTESNLESGLTKYVKFFIYSENGVELGHYTEAVIIGDNLTSKADLMLTTLRAPNVLTITLKENGSTYTGSEKTGFVLKTFPEEDFSYPMTKQGGNDTYSATIINGKKYILYDGDYNTKLLFIPTATGTSDGIVEYCSTVANAKNVLKNDENAQSGLGIILADSNVTTLSADTEEETFSFCFSKRNDKVSLNLEECVKVNSIAQIFWSNKNIVSLSTPKNLTTFEQGFYAIKSLAALYINGTGTDIRYWFTLTETEMLEYLSLPASLSYIDCSGLGNCLKLKKIVIAEDNTTYKSVDGCIMSKDGKTLYSWPMANGDITIPEGITTIDSGTFCNNTRITSVNLPSTLNKLGDSVFSGCTTLRNVTIPNGVTEIGYSAFSGCSNINKIVIPETVSSIRGGAFNRCSHLKSITLPEGLTSIEDGTFYGCSALEKIKIPSTVKILGQSFDPDNDMYDFHYESAVFGYCTSLKEILLPEALEELGVYAFYECRELKNITLSPSLTKIDPYAFCNSGLTSITVPDNVEYIGEFAFGNCPKLQTISIGSGVKCIEQAPFVYCSELTSLTVSSANQFYKTINNSLFSIDNKKLLYWYDNGKEKLSLPEDLEEIYSYCFYNNTTITEIEFPKSLLLIGDYAFSKCSNISKVDIPDSVTRIGYRTFAECSSLETVKLPANLKTFGGFTFDGTKIKEVRIPSGVTYFGPYTFECYGLEKVYFEEGLESINDYNWGFSNSSIKEVYFPKSLKIIGMFMFGYANNITDIYYAGTEDDWKKVSISSDYSGSLLTATVHYNSEY